MSLEGISPLASFLTGVGNQVFLSPGPVLPAHPCSSDTIYMFRAVVSVSLLVNRLQGSEEPEQEITGTRQGPPSPEQRPETVNEVGLRADTPLRPDAQWYQDGGSGTGKWGGRGGRKREKEEAAGGSGCLCLLFLPPPTRHLHSSFDLIQFVGGS